MSFSKIPTPTHLSSQQRKTAARLYEEARAAIAQKNWSEAVTKLDRVMDLVPDFPGAYERHAEAHYWHRVHTLYEMGCARMKANMWPEALDALREVRNLEKDYRDVQMRIGICERRLGYVRDVAPTVGFVPAMAGAVALLLTVLGGYYFLYGGSTDESVAQSLSTATVVSPGAPGVAPTGIVLVLPSPTSPNLPPNQTTIQPPSSTAPAITGGATATRPPATATPRPPVVQPTRTSTPRPPAASTATSVPTAIPTQPLASPTSAVVIALTTTTPIASPTTPLVPSPTPTPTPIASPSPIVSPTPLPPTATATRPAPTATPAPRNVQVTASSFRFEPAALTFTAGERIRLMVKNNSSITHTWALMRGNAELSRITVEANSEAPLNFTAPSQTGAYIMICVLADHADRGMRGNVTVR